MEGTEPGFDDATDREDMFKERPEDGLGRLGVG